MIYVMCCQLLLKIVWICHTIKWVQWYEELVEARVTIPNNQLELITTTLSIIYFGVVFFWQQLQSVWIWVHTFSIFIYDQIWELINLEIYFT